ncbi:MAG: (Fe-S)-binding protein, partial [Hyphomicrobiales bacterium]|nr:(Fe-S)-binding protein [Hyphomicrobiales bacterium]
MQGADILLVTPSADFFASPHMEGLIGYAKVLHEAGVSWTLSTYASEAANFGMFVGSQENMQKVAQRIAKAARDLGVKRLVFGECGHAWRV